MFKLIRPLILAGLVAISCVVPSGCGDSDPTPIVEIEVVEPNTPEEEEVVIESENLDSNSDSMTYIPEDTVEDLPIEEPEEEEFVSYYPHTDYELDLFARLIEAESGGESYKVKLGVGSVVLNRINSEYFPNSLEEVIYQTYPSIQFSVICTYINGVLMIDRPASEESIKAAKELLDYGSILPEDVQFFYSVYVQGNWINTRAIYDVWDTTVFAYHYPNS